VNTMNAVHQSLHIPAAGTVLEADIGLPGSPGGAVLLAVAVAAVAIAHATATWLTSSTAPDWPPCSLK